MQGEFALHELAAAEFSLGAKEGVQGWASAPTLLGVPVVLAETALVARAYAPTPLALPVGQAYFGESFFFRIAAASPLCNAQAQARAVWGVRAGVASPLGAVQVVGQTVAEAYCAAPTPLGQPEALFFLPLVAFGHAPSLLGAPALLAYHDFTASLGDIVTRYVMDLVTPTGTMRVPISSWQATLQTGSSSYVQCVIPACSIWMDAINGATEFVISRRAVLPSGMAIEHEMARAPAEQPQFDRGPTNHSCTLSGYSDAFAANDNPASIFDRPLTGARSISSSGGHRVRCAIDWLLRPGHRALVNGISFVVRYINYYAPSNFDAYMDVGS